MKTKQDVKEKLVDLDCDYRHYRVTPVKEVILTVQMETLKWVLRQEPWKNWFNWFETHELYETESQKP